MITLKGFISNIVGYNFTHAMKYHRSNDSEEVATTKTVNNSVKKYYLARLYES